MAIAQGQVNQHWNYFLALDADLSKVSRYVEFHPLTTIAASPWKSPEFSWQPRPRSTW